MIASPLMQATADRIKALRAARALTQEDLAALAGRSVASVQRIERGEKVSAYTIASIAAAFDITAEALTAAPNLNCYHISGSVTTHFSHQCFQMTATI